jgi:thioredoxin reductase
MLVVGGGDSAIEAATGLANQTGNVVTLSYRKHDFFRLKARNEERIRDYMAKGRVRVFFSSEVVRVEPEAVVLSVLKKSKEGEGESREQIRIDNDFVFVFAGGDPPFELLRKIGIGFGSEGKSPTTEAGRSVLTR